jgi:hypothetical protein
MKLKLTQTISNTLCVCSVTTLHYIKNVCFTLSFMRLYVLFKLFLEPPGFQSLVMRRDYSREEGVISSLLFDVYFGRLMIIYSASI